jgi:hypothetical protein
MVPTYCARDKIILEVSMETQVKRPDFFLTITGEMTEHFFGKIYQTIISRSGPL